MEAPYVDFAESPCPHATVDASSECEWFSPGIVGKERDFYPKPEANTQMERLKEVMTLREASQYLGISPDTLYKYLGEDKIPAFKLGNRWRFKKDLLDRWMESKSERGPGPRANISARRNS